MTDKQPMKKPEHPLNGGGAMSAVATVIALGVVPMTAMGVAGGLVIGGVLGAVGGVSGFATGLAWGAGIPAALGGAATALMLALPWVGYGFEMAEWQFRKPKPAAKQAKSKQQSMSGLKSSMPKSIKKLFQKLSQRHKNDKTHNPDKTNTAKPSKKDPKPPTP